MYIGKNRLLRVFLHSVMTEKSHIVALTTQEEKTIIGNNLFGKSEVIPMANMPKFRSLKSFALATKDKIAIAKKCSNYVT